MEKFWNNEELEVIETLEPFPSQKKFKFSRILFLRNPTSTT